MPEAVGMPQVKFHKVLRTAGSWWLMPLTLATWEAETENIAV
jgi:hypothetical protein